MLSVVQAFERFLTGLEIKDAEREAVARQQQRIGARLAKSLGGVRRDLLAGAYARGTAIRPLHDIDLFIVLENETHGGLREQGPGACIEAIESALLREGPLSRERIERRGRAVNLKLEGEQIGFDLVPAFETSPGVYAIPDREGRGFLETNPALLEQALTHANERAGSKLVPVIRAARHWSARHDNPINGLHLEALAPKAIPTPPLSYPHALRQLFAKLVDISGRPCPDPGGVGPDLNAGMTYEDQSRLRIMLQDATRQADQALQYERTWRAEEAHGVWRSLLGEAYPEAGRR